jgi:hypothetical protein
MRLFHASSVTAVAVATTLSGLLLVPRAGSAEEPGLAPAPVVAPTSGHIMCSGGLGSQQEETLVILPSTHTNQVPGDARWAPDPATVLMNQVTSDARWAPAPSWDAMSGYDTVEATHAALAAPLLAPVPDTLAATLANGTRAESAHLATIPLPGETGNVNPSDDRIAAAFGART